MYITVTEDDLSDIARRLGANGGRRAAENMTKAERVARAKKAVAARERNKRKTKRAG
jgi:hypothetical protein